MALENNQNQNGEEENKDLPSFSDNLNYTNAQETNGHDENRQFEANYNDYQERNGNNTLLEDEKKFRSLIIQAMVASILGVFTLFIWNIVIAVRLFTIAGQVKQSIWAYILGASSLATLFIFGTIVTLALSIAALVIQDKSMNENPSR